MIDAVIAGNSPARVWADDVVTPRTVWPGTGRTGMARMVAMLHDDETLLILPRKAFFPFSLAWVGDRLCLVGVHDDWSWDARVLRTLTSLDTSFRALCDDMAGCLERFGGYADRYSSALGKAQTGQRAWVDGPDRESCHIVWIQFHEDLLATLGIPRGCDV
jgi:hypothetical protein